jgi:hypothetical protein
MRFASSQVVLLSIALAGFARTAVCADPKDACLSQIPASLAAAVQAQFPKYRLPLVTDNDADDIQYNRDNGGSGCLGVASGDFDGDGTKDFALALTPLSGPKGLAVVALSLSGKWTFKVIYREDRARLYVAVVPPDRYQRPVPIYAPLAKDETEDLRCCFAGIAVGMTESTETVYCMIKGGWIHVVMGD